MENAADALKMAFAVFVFVAAISLALNSFTKAKETADAILYYTDKVNYYEWADSSDQKAGRVVGKDAIIASLYRVQSDTYIIVDLKTTKYIFNQKRVTEVTASNVKTINTEEVDNMHYLINFINKTLPNNATYVENVSEVTNEGMLGGEYITAEDGTKLQVVQGDNKVIVTYIMM